MRRCVPAIVFAILLFTGRTALADSVAVGDKLHMLNSGGAISGGEFNVDIVGKGNEPPLFDFVTFCVQLRQDINKDDDFTVGYIGDRADDEVDPDPSDGPGDPLDEKTAWIYWQYRQPGQGALSGYTENEVQNAIWVIEQEWDFAEQNIFFPPSRLANLELNTRAIMDAAAAAVSPAGGWTNNNRVQILGLFFPNGDIAQDMLMLDDGGGTITQVETPEPATLLLVGGGVAALIRRRVRGWRNG
jgi:hypothetical protein